MKPGKIKQLFMLLPLAVIGSKSVHAQITLTGGDYLSTPASIVIDQVKVTGLSSLSGLGSISSNDKIRTYKFVDGFGRPLQDIVEGGSPNGKDLIQLYKYDEFGRTTQQYLPFEYTSVGSGTPYQDRSTAISNQATFYNTGTTANKIAADSKPWVQADVEQSPMQRLLKQGNAGDGFQTNQHYKSMVYRACESGDNVRKWASDGTSSGTYSANELSVTEGIDENSVHTIVFTDKLGRTVLKRQQADETIGGTSYSYFDTYYVYDLLGNIAYVIPPKAVVKLSSGGTWDATTYAPNLIFSYKYDNKNRVTEKKVPGTAVVYMVYDPLDRVVLTQNGLLRDNNKWFYSKYDASGRVVVEGIYTDATHTSLSSMQSYVSGLSCYGSSSTTYYEDKSSGTASYYTNNCFPTSSTEERLYYYYDNYDVDATGTSIYAYVSQSLPGELTAASNTLSLPTAMRRRILGSSDWLISVSFYDKWYNNIQVQSGNQFAPGTPGKSRVTSVFDFSGALKERKEEHVFSRTASLTIRNSYTYDKMNRLTQLKQGHNGGTMIIVGSYEYNSLGQLVDKKLHSTNNGSTYLQSVDYRYNIRGQLTSINNSTLSNDSGTTNDESNDVWGMNLLYDQTETGSGQIGNTANWTGMLSAVKWKASISGGNTDQRTYLFTYDKLYRLTAASYKAYNTGSSNWTKETDGYNESATYDWGGNILTMLRKSVISGTVTTIDNLTYDYGTNNDNNKLVNMTESSSNSYGYRNFTSSSSGYTYDSDGNLTADAKKGTTITYNEMNKPVTITQTSTGKYVTFGYDGAGTRLSKTIYDGSTTTIEYYIGGVVVSSTTTLRYFAMAEGRVRNVSGTLKYEYFITDQQGNVRVSFEDNGSGTAVARQENSYYPFGMAMGSNYTPTDDNKLLYNAGSRFQDEMSGLIDYFSTFFREYDPVIGRFNSVDPKAEITAELSIYHYAGNNPTNFNDPLGNETSGDYSHYWTVWLNLYYVPASSSGTYHFENGRTISFDPLTTDLASSMLRNIGSLVTRFNDLEQEVRELTKAGKYTQAFRAIYKFYANDWGVTSDQFMLTSQGSDLGNVTRPRDEDELQTDPAKASVSMSFILLQWLFDPTEKAGLLNRYKNDRESLLYLQQITFSDVVRGFYHEIAIHVKDIYGQNEFGFRPPTQAEREFRAYYAMWTAPGLPEGGGLKFRNWFAVVFGSDSRLGAYSQLSPEKQTFYKSQYKEMLNYVIMTIFNVLPIIN